MTFFQFILFGSIRGLIESLPISSSAHLIITPNQFGWHNPALIVGLVIVAIVGYLSIRWILSFLAKRPHYLFTINYLVASIIINMYDFVRS
jgi:undecaprenyl pyrophosphate phosphatase UppP